MRREMLKVFESVDVLISPTTPTTAESATPQSAESGATDSMERFELDRCEDVSYCGLYALIGMPAISIPCGFSSNTPELPVGLQLGGPPFSEGRLFRAAHAYEEATQWYRRRPPLPTNVIY